MDSIARHSEIIIVPLFFASVVYVISLLLTTWQRRQRLRLVTEFHTRLLDRLGSVKDFNDLLATPAGAQFIRELGSEPMTIGPHDRILRAVQLGAVLGCLGIGLLLLSFFSPLAADELRRTFDAFGTIALSLGIGFALSSAAAYRIASRLGILQPRRSGVTEALQR